MKRLEQIKWLSSLSYAVSEIFHSWLWTRTNTRLGEHKNQLKAGEYLFDFIIKDALYILKTGNDYSEVLDFTLVFLII